MESKNQEGIFLLDVKSNQEEKIEYNDNSKWGLAKFLSGPIFNLLNVILGAGVLGLPFAFHQSGYIIGIILLLIVGVSTLFSFYYLLRSSETCQVFTYKDLANNSMGGFAGILVDVIIIIDTLGTLAAYQVLVGDSLHRFLSNFVSLSNPFMDPKALIGLSLLLTVPLCLLKNISWLEYTSFLSIWPLAYLLLLQIIFLGIYGSPGGVIAFGSYTGFFLALPIFIFSYSSQSTFFPIYNSLKKQGGTYPHMKGVIGWSVSITWVLYILCSLLGVIAYPTNTKGNIMLNLPRNGAVDVLLITMAISIIFSFPVIIWPTRESADQILMTAFWRCKKVENPPKTYGTDTIQSQNCCTTTYICFVIETLFFISISVGIAMGIPSFVTILGLCGSITKMAICYLFPPTFYLLLEPGSVRENKRKWGAILLIVFGVVAGVASAVITIISYVDGETVPEFMTNETLNGKINFNKLI